MWAIAVALFPWALFLVLGYFNWRHNQRRLEMLHQERMAAIEKGSPLVEMPDLDGINPFKRPMKSYPNAVLVLSIVFIAVGAGAMGAMALSSIPELHAFWSTPLPLVLLGVGLLLCHILTRQNAR
jgi:hypothetical protein